MKLSRDYIAFASGLRDYIEENTDLEYEDADKVAMVLFSHDSEYVIRRYPDPYRKDKTVFQRMALCIYVPVHLVLIGPIKWLVTGEYGLDSRKPISRLILKICGEE